MNARSGGRNGRLSERVDMRRIRGNARGKREEAANAKRRRSQDVTIKRISCPRITLATTWQAKEIGDAFGN